MQALFDLPATKAIGTATARQALGSLQAGAPDALAQASAAGSQVFTAGAPEAPNPVFSALADTGWNAVKNLEPLIDSATLADANVTLGQDQGVLTLGVTNASTPGFRAATAPCWATARMRCSIGWPAPAAWPRSKASPWARTR